MAAKLGVKAEGRVKIFGSPRGWSIRDAPDSVRVGHRRGGPTADVVIAFFNDTASLKKRITLLSDEIAVDGALWIAWPRKAAGHVSDLSDNVVRTTLLPLGLVDVKVAAVDHDWSALKFVWRKELRSERITAISSSRTR